MTVHFLHLPFDTFYSFVPKKIINFPMVQAASFLKAQNIPVIIHGTASNQHIELKNVLEQINHDDWIVVPLYDATKCAEILKLATDLQKLSGARLVATSYLATFSTEEILTVFPSINHVIQGEEEFTLYNLVTTKSNIFDGVIRAEPVNPNLWVYPDGARINGYKLLQTSRGCAHSCSFCCTNYFTNFSRMPDWRGLSADKVLAWLERAAGEGIRFIELIDADFLGSNECGLARANDLVSAKGPGIPIMAATRADTIVRQSHLLKKLKNFGIVKWQVGVESAAPDTLRSFNKGFTPETSMRAINILNDIGASVRLEFIMFEPWSTMETLKKNLDMLLYLSDQGVIIQRALFNRLRIGRWAPDLFNALLNEGRLIRHIFPLYDYKDVDPSVESIFSAVYKGHTRCVGAAIATASLLERLQDLSAFNDIQFVQSKLLELDMVLATFVDKVLQSAGKIDSSKYLNAVEALNNAANQWLNSAYTLLENQGVNGTFPEIISLMKRAFSNVIYPGE